MKCMQNILPLLLNIIIPTVEGRYASMTQFVAASLRAAHWNSGIEGQPITVRVCSDVFSQKGNILALSRLRARGQLVARRPQLDCAKLKDSLPAMAASCAVCHYCNRLCRLPAKPYFEPLFWYLTHEKFHLKWWAMTCKSCGG